MGISRPTFTKLIKLAHGKVAEALIEGKMLIIEGGPIHFRENILHCTACNSYFKCEIGETKNLRCPNCGSSAVKSLAERYGHGRCCHNRGN
jgi:Zn finger protein HypA/HybF involved in hydrogenase expression